MKEESTSDNCAPKKMKNDEESVAREPLLNGASINSKYDNVPYTWEARFAEILVATDHFNKANILGKGGFGTVYKAVWMGTPAAIKRLTPKIGDKGRARKIAQEQAVTEFNVFKRCFNLDGGPCDQILRLYAISLNQDPCIVYQLMENGTLEDRLLCRNDSSALTWSQRADIAESIAKGLCYLHTTLAKPIVHGDIKSANILLDENMQPKIGDFGLALELPSSDETCVKVSNLRGTPCYLPNEYLRYKKLSPQLDIYSYGIVLLEIATGMRPIDSDSKTHLTKQVEACKQYGRRSLLRDDKAGADNPLWFGNLLRIGQACSNREMEKRPASQTVLKIFEEAKTIISDFEKPRGSESLIRRPPTKVPSTRMDVILDQIKERMEDNRAGRRSTSQSSRKSESTTSLGEIGIEIEQLEREAFDQYLPIYLQICRQKKEKVKDNPVPFVTSLKQSYLRFEKRSLEDIADARMWNDSDTTQNLLKLAQCLILSYRQERAELTPDRPPTRKYSERVDHLLNLAESLLLSIRQQRQYLLLDRHRRPSLIEITRKLLKANEKFLGVYEMWLLRLRQERADLLQDWPQSREYAERVDNENSLGDCCNQRSGQTNSKAPPVTGSNSVQTIRQEIKSKLSLAQHLLSSVRQEFAGLLPECLHTENLPASDFEFSDSESSDPESSDSESSYSGSSDSDTWSDTWSTSSSEIEPTINVKLRGRKDSNQNVEVEARESPIPLPSDFEKTVSDVNDANFTENLPSSDSKSSDSDLRSKSSSESEANINVKLCGRGDSDQNVEVEAREPHIPLLSIFEKTVRRQ